MRWGGSLVILLAATVGLQATTLSERFDQPPAGTGPWVFWYWMQGAVSREGISADLEAMKAVGLEGATLFTIQDAPDPPWVTPPARVFSPTWWQLIDHTFREADRLGLKLGLHACDGFSLAGGPWITPELSMQRLVWSRTEWVGAGPTVRKLSTGPVRGGFYRDIAVLAFPSPPGTGRSTRTVVPEVHTSVPGVNAGFLVDPNSDQRLRSNEPCWIEYRFSEPFTCRSVRIEPDGTSFQPLRLAWSVSDDGESWRDQPRLVPPRHGWQDSDAAMTYAVTPVTGRFFRFVYDPNGSEPGSEDLDRAKWRASLKLRRLELFSRAQIHQFEGKNGSVWRVSRATTALEVPGALCVPGESVVDLTDRLDASGTLRWDVPAGRWTVLRIGATTTGHTNATGGAARGLECDKFNPEAVALQFDGWFGRICDAVGPDLARRVIRLFHTDSWEAGGQNWSGVMPGVLERRWGPDWRRHLVVLTGTPVDSAAASEHRLRQWRGLLDDLLQENFFGTLARRVHRLGYRFSAESVAPTLLSDNLRHAAAVDIPMGEFWYRSPTHDKPNDIRDAVSAAHLYGRPVVGAEAFTELRFAWDEAPWRVKALGDRNFCFGVNRFWIHVFVHNPWRDRRPGMSLGPTGLFFQRDQTWFPAADAWIDYLRRCQAVLQGGVPVVDVAVWTGDDWPRRGVLPERLVDILPGLVGPRAVERERRRRANQGLPLREMPRGVRASAHLTDPGDWIDPLRGYAYDSINTDALCRVARIEDGGLRMPSGVHYRVLVVPGPRPMAPAAFMAESTRQRLRQVQRAGVGLIMADPLPSARSVPFVEPNLASLGIAPDLQSRPEGVLAWTHRRYAEADVYFVSNPTNQTLAADLSLRAVGQTPELWDPLTGRRRPAARWSRRSGRTELSVSLPAQGSLFVVVPRQAALSAGPAGDLYGRGAEQAVPGPWQVRFQPAAGPAPEPVTWTELADWRRSDDPNLRDFSGTACYRATVDLAADRTGGTCWLDLGQVRDIAVVTVNGQPCGTAWTAPWRVDVTAALQPGRNDLRIDVTNTWANRLAADGQFPQAERSTWTLHPERAAADRRVSAGLLGPVRLILEERPGSRPDGESR